MAIWTFYNYVSDIGTEYVAKWERKKLVPQERADLDALLAALANTRVWTSSDYDTLTNGDGLGEIRWRGNQRKALRVIGLRDADAKAFVCFLGCIHKDNVYDPPD